MVISKNLDYVGSLIGSYFLKKKIHLRGFSYKSALSLFS